MKIMLTVFILTLLPASALCATIYVPDDYPTIQWAIDASKGGDTIIVRPGTYVENIDYLGKAIAVRSEKGPGVTIIDGGNPVDPYLGCVVRFMSGEGLSSILDGFTITNGTGFRGGTSSVTGGGIYCWFSEPTICNNVVMGNSAVNSQKYGTGGGIAVRNHGGFGATIVNNVIRDNTAGLDGGGLYFSSDEYGIIENNLICDNHAGLHGGGVYVNWSITTLVNNIIVGNSTDGSGGGVYADYTVPEIRNCTIVWNSAVRRGGGITLEPYSATITNTILWGNSPDQLSESYLDVMYSDIQGGYPGTGNIDAPPFFADALHYDFHLTVQSPCRDTGSNAEVASTLDWEGDPRIAWGRVDMGADEFYFHLYSAGAANPGSPIDFKVVGPPGASPVRLLLGNATHEPPFSTPYGDLYLTIPIRPFDLGAIPSNGVLASSQTVPGWWLPGEKHPFQALIGPLAPGSKLTNLLVLEVK